MSGLQHTAITKASVKRKYSEYKQGLLKKEELAVGGEKPKDIYDEYFEAINIDYSKPCWRCRLSRIPCKRSESHEFCRNCYRHFLEDTEGEWEFDCLRDDLDKNVEKTIPNIPGLGSDEWFLPAAGGIWLRFQMSYKHPDYRFRDLDEFAKPNDSILQRTEAIIAFTDQFRVTRRSCWPTHCCKPMTKEILKVCASIQVNILETTRESWNPLNERNTVIATALQALALTNNIEFVCQRLGEPEEEEFVENSWLEPEIITDHDEDDNVTVEVSRVEDTSEIGKKGGLKLRALITHVFRVVQNMILKPKGVELPTILCVLCILKLVEKDLEPRQDFLTGFGFWGGEFDAAWNILCKLYHLIARNYHPIRGHWHKSLYLQVVGQEGIWSVTYFRELQKIWTADGFDKKCMYMSFPERLEHFAMGDDMSWQEEEEED
ncbi:hypothetical protein BDZ45DRAFT_409413 [Acephala macrosclerotiorum]|nr:hypothetical protein BDZ45DRAFT_409413 [Acephala macrosclerotiorum]